MAENIKFIFGADALVEESLIDSMRDAMTHRGPDGAGTWISKDRVLAWVIGGFRSLTYPLQLGSL